MNLILISISVLKWFFSKTPGMNDLDNFNTTQWGFRSTLKMTLLLDTNGKSYVLLKSFLSLSFEKQKSKLKSQIILEKRSYEPLKSSHLTLLWMEILDKAQTQCLTKLGILQNPFLMYLFLSSTKLHFPVGCFYQGFLSSTCPDHAEIAGEVRQKRNKRNGLLNFLKYKSGNRLPKKQRWSPHLVKIYCRAKKLILQEPSLTIPWGSSEQENISLMEIGI